MYIDVIRTTTYTSLSLGDLQIDIGYSNNE